MLSLFYLIMTPKGKSSDAGSSIFFFFSDDGISLYLFIYLAVLVLSCGMGNLSIHRMDSLVEHMGSTVAGYGLCCSAAYEILVLQPRIQSVSPALQGEFFTTGLPGKSPDIFLLCLIYKWNSIIGMYKKKKIYMFRYYPWF